MREAGVSSLDLINGDAQLAREQLMRCCGSRSWVEAMLRQRPFRNATHLYQCASCSWRGLKREDWLDAFSHHPRIGEPRSGPALDAKQRELAQREQSGAAEADASVRAALVEGNRQYEAKFGHVFLVCATGKSGAQILALLRKRLANDAGAELAVAADEQEKITRLRLEKLVCP
jgi:2-oxo-4-hydroxy-4-carboxy-5-ureidoimidazoline decarboxylase